MDFETIKRPVTRGIDYLDDKLKQKIGAPDEQKMNALKIGAGAGAVGSLGAVGAIMGVVGAAGLIKSVYDKMNWKKQGCLAIPDPSKKALCLNYLKTKALKELSAKYNQCADEKCKQVVQSEVDKLNTSKISF